VRAAFQPLFRVRVRHGYYASGRAEGDYLLEPSELTRRLTHQGVILKPLADGCAALVEVLPGTAPAQLARPLAAADLQFTFLCHARSPHLQNVTDLPAYRPGRTVFAFDNLRDDRANNLLHLGDAVSGTRQGPAIALAAGSTLAYTLPAPAATASLTLKDRFGKTRWQGTLVLADATQPTADVRFDLSSIPGIGPGRYTLSDAAGGSMAFYYDPDLNGRRPFAIVEIFASTATLTSGGSEFVPAPYRFLTGDRITLTADYVIAFEPRATTWRYRVQKKYASNDVTLAGLTVDGPVSFTRPPDGRPIFSSAAPLKVSETMRPVVLKHDGKLLRNLPNPSVATPLGLGAAAGQFVSEFVVNV
jgi:hypothetical protein